MPGAPLKARRAWHETPARVASSPPEQFVQVLLEFNRRLCRWLWCQHLLPALLYRCRVCVQVLVRPPAQLFV